MTLMNWFSGVSRSTARRPSRRPRLEALEDRVVPAGLPTPNQNFAAQIYLDLFNRPADAAGFSAAVHALDTGALTPLQLAQSFVHAAEHRALEINEAYERFVSREVDPASLNAALALFQNGGTLLQLEGILAGSQEFAGKAGGSDTAFIDRLYQVGVNRPADVPGQASAEAGILLGQSHGQVALGFLESPEALAVQVQRAFGRDLRRDAGPGELNAATAAEAQAGFNFDFIESDVFGSTEYYQLANTHATHLTFSSQADGTAGQGLGAVVAALDDAGRLDRFFSGGATLAIGSSPAGGALSGTTSVTFSRGFAVFPDASLNKAGTYTLTASAAGLPTATSNPFAIKAAPATQFALGVPTSSTAGEVFHVTATAEDQFGNVDTNFNGPVQLAIGTNPGGGTLSGTTAGTASGGVVSFSGLSIEKSGVGYTLTATSGGIGGTSPQFNVTAAAANHLAFTVQTPATTQAGAGFNVTVSALDQFNNLDTTFNQSVTLTAPNNTLGGTTTRPANGGMASFTGIFLQEAGTGFMLHANGGGLSGVSNAFTVTPAPATQLVFTGLGNVVVNNSFNLSITAEDQFGNQDTTYNQGVNLTIDPNFNPGSSALGGTTTGTFAGGSVSFSNLTLNHTGNGYKLKATSGSLTGDSASFNVTAAGVNVSVMLISGTNPSNVDQSVSFKATVRPTQTGQPTPTGTVQFVIDPNTADQANLGGAVNLTDNGDGSSSAVSPSTSTLSGGTRTIQAIFTPSNNQTYVTTNGSTTQTVNAVAPTVQITTLVNNADHRSVNITVTVSDPNGATTFAPNGTVALSDPNGNSVALPSGTLTPGSGTSSITFSGVLLDAHNHTLIATYTPANTETNFSTNTGSRGVNFADEDVPSNDNPNAPPPVNDDDTNHFSLA
jgi:hypothetical protein